MNPIMMVSKIAATCNLTIDDEIEHSKLLTAIQIVVIMISIAHLGFIPYAVIYIEQIPELSQNGNETVSFGGNLSSQKFITKMANIIIISIMSIAVRISNLFQLGKYLPVLLDDINNFDKIFPKRNNQDFRRNIILSVILLIISWPYQIYSILVVTTDDWIAFLMFYLNLYNNFSIISCEFQFVSICWILKTRYEKLNKVMSDLYSLQYEDNDAVLVHLNDIKKSYKFLCDSFTKLNNIYGFQMFVILNGLFLNVLFGFYFSIFGGFTKHSRTSDAFQRISNAVNESLWSIYYLARFVFVCFVAETATNQANIPRRTICNSLDKTKYHLIRQELWTFLAHTMTHKRFFTAFGFFKINKSLITSAVSMGTTYLVILAQFQKK